MSFPTEISRSDLISGICPSEPCCTVVCSLPPPPARPRSASPGGCPSQCSAPPRPRCSSRTPSETLERSREVMRRSRPRPPAKRRGSAATLAPASTTTRRTRCRRQRGGRPGQRRYPVLPGLHPLPPVCRSLLERRLLLRILFFGQLLGKRADRRARAWGVPNGGGRGRRVARRPLACA